MYNLTLTDEQFRILKAAVTHYVGKPAPRATAEAFGLLAGLDSTQPVSDALGVMLNAQAVR
jgi:hypothetical protein